MKKTVLVCLDNLGDLVLASALARSLGSEPDRELHLWCKEYCAPVGRLVPTVKKVHAADPFWCRAPGRRGGSILRFFRVLRAIKRENYAEAFIASTCWRTAIAIWLAGIKVRIAPKGRRNMPWLTGNVAMPPLDVPAASGWVNSFAPYLKGPLFYQCRLECDRDGPAASLALPAATRGMAVLHPFAGSPRRCAGMDLWHSLGSWLAGQGYFVLFTGSREELERWRLAKGGWEPCHYADHWATDLSGLVRLWSRAALFVGHYSGPAHIAHALGVPTVGLYLPGEPLRTFPQGEGAYRLIVKQSPAELGLAEIKTAICELEEGDVSTFSRQKPGLHK